MVEKENWFKKIEDMHPYQTLTYLGMVGSGLVFLFMTVAFVISQPEKIMYENFTLPKSFLLSSLLLILSGFTASYITSYYQEDNTRKMKQALGNTFLLGLGFTGLQFMGWKELSVMGIDFQGLPSGSFLYVLSGIHVLHLFGAMIFSLILLVQIQKCEKDPIKNIFMLANPFDKMKLKLFVTYWKFMEIVWLVLLLLIFWVF